MRDEEMWQAVQRRDHGADRRFVYGVVTTGVYCRPSCAARQPLRDNVRFFATPAQAGEAGLRPCKRCRPLEHWQNDPEVALLLDLCRFVDAQAELPGVAALSERSGKDAFQLNRLFQRYLTITPGDYIESVRLRRIKHALRDSTSVTDAVYDAGLGSSRGLYERAPRSLGMTPRQYRRGGEGLDISYAIGDTPLGPVCIGATDRGICYLQFGEDREALLAQLAAEYPQARLAPMTAQAQPAFDAWMQALNAHLDGRQPSLDLPLDIRGTAFQVRVWNYLRSIPYGEVVSYGEAAAAIDAPRATRALASACAKNRIAVLVPCHRVIRGDGDLGGYRWGIPRKRALIDVERRATRQRDR
ncbi:bifunctional DNA-binding transcriptional regulator/O6-methylguanine-DNA methyltransferase Ada [Dokdonella soli]|uniref:Bifunctional DNA-binding transcriptional regulator/O6-methylguanine-DNA methyltransferase Ada n=1 Tax=Dokdonella soli TaxID=529810 RepID=A0ABN1IFK1_9GAMM